MSHEPESRSPPPRRWVIRDLPAGLTAQYEADIAAGRTTDEALARSLGLGRIRTTRCETCGCLCVALTDVAADQLLAIHRDQDHG